MLTQEECDEEEGPEGEAAEGEEEEDDESEEGYESPEDPFPPEARRRPTEEDLDKDFDPNEEVGKKGKFEPLHPQYKNFVNGMKY